MTAPFPLAASIVNPPRDEAMNLADTTEDRVAMLHSLLNDAAKKVGEQRGHIQKLEEALRFISEACPSVPTHPFENEYDFSAQYFNTPDDYARYASDQDKADIGKFARAALSGAWLSAAERTGLESSSPAKTEQSQSIADELVEVGEVGS